MKLIHGDCLEVMKDIPEGSVNMILCDLPYGTTACKWDIIIPFKPLWAEYNRIIKKGGCIALFGSEPFSSYLRMSNIKKYKYDWIWDKKIPSGMVFARYQPMRQHEIISIFNCNIYFPQTTRRHTQIKAGGMSKGETTNNQKLIALKKTYDFKNPITILEFDKIRIGSVHPTQKPVALTEYLIKTYTLENEVVLDNCMGSGTTGVACRNLNRNFIGIELDKKYFKIAKRRIRNAKFKHYNPTQTVSKKIGLF